MVQADMNSPDNVSRSFIMGIMGTIVLGFVTTRDSIYEHSPAESRKTAKGMEVLYRSIIEGVVCSSWQEHGSPTALRVLR
jgi:hypothetical protein